MKRTPALAGRFADEYNMFACDAETLAARAAVMTSTATELGRDPAEIKISVMSSAVVGEDEAEYRELLKAAAAARNREPDELADAWKQRRLIHGTYEQAAEQVAAYAAEGVGRIYIQHFDPLGELNTADFARQLRGLSG
jgi:alkanesulfonate monooxygenase SsuD/methylene tetrahydromethanopterin reductase-like flavin-dependent oxidoreductase (luciferase family)